MNYKIEGTIKRNKNRFIIFFVLWLFMTIVLVAPVAYAQKTSTIDGVFNLNTFFNEIFSAYSNFGNVLRKFRKLYCRIF